MFNKVLIKIAKEFNKSKIRYAVGFSSVLKYYGIVSKAQDIDIVVNEKDYNKAIEIMNNLGDKIEQEKKVNGFISNFFVEYKVDNVDVDLMSNIKITFGRGTYTYIFDRKSIGEKVMIDDTEVPLIAIEDLYVLYQLIDGKQEKVEMIEDYFKKNKVRHKALLKRTLSQELPLKVINRSYILFESKR